MKKIALILTILVLFVVGLFVFFNPNAWLFQTRSMQEPQATTTAETDPNEIEVVAEDLSVPWGMGFLPDGNILLTERTGRLLEMTQSGEIITELEIESAVARGEGGLLGIALHPDFSDNHLLYLYQTYEDQDGTKNRITRFRYAEGELTESQNIISEIAGASYHDGGRIAFSPDGYLFVTVGDAGSTLSAQDNNTPNGAILRLNPDGSIPEGNPFGNALYSYGHRNPQGLAWDRDGRLWATEHGRSGIRSGLDEVNLIKLGSNYGWPYLEGDETCMNHDIYDPPLPSDLSGVNCSLLAPLKHSGPDITWAPASAAINDNLLFFAGLRGQAIYTTPIIFDGTELRLGEITAHFKERFGRLRTVKIGPDQEYLYVTTSNTDGRGNPDSSDDKLIRIPLSIFR